MTGMAVITFGGALQRGVERCELSGPGYRRLFHGVYATASEPDTLQTWVRAARLFLPEDAVLTGLSALQWHGLGLGRRHPLTFVTTRRGHTGRRGVDVRCRGVLPDGPVATVSEAFVEFGRESTFADAVAVGDALLDLGLLDREGWSRLDDSDHVPVRRASGAMRVGAGSPRESLLRLAVTEAGLPEPRLQARLGDERGPIGRVDLLLDEFGVVLEYEGRQHLSDSRQWTSDVTRYERLTAAGFVVIRVTAERLQDPRTLVSQIHEALRGRGYRGRRPRFTARFMSLFSGSVL